MEGVACVTHGDHCKLEGKEYEMARGYTDILAETLDRMAWKVDLQKLQNHGYLNAHCPRPYSKSIPEMAPLLEYIKENYK